MQKIYYFTITTDCQALYVNKEIRAQKYVQIVQRTVEIELQIAKDHNSLDTFKKKWSRLKPSLFKTNVLFCGSELLAALCGGAL